MKIFDLCLNKIQAYKLEHRAFEEDKIQSIKFGLTLSTRCLTPKIELFISRTHLTEAKEPFIDWKYTGIHARTPCIFWKFFIFAKHAISMPINCLNCKSGLVIWEYQKYTKQKPRNLKLIKNILSYELVRRAFFYMFCCCQKQLFSAY